MNQKLTGRVLDLLQLMNAQVQPDLLSAPSAEFAAGASGDGSEPCNPS